MASKFTVNAAFQAHLLLRPSHRRPGLFRIVNKLEGDRPTLPPILSSRSYSDSTSIPPFPTSRRPTESSQSSGPGNKNWFSPKVWSKVLNGVLTGAGVLTGTLATVGLAGGGIFLYEDWYPAFRRRLRESALESAICDKLKKGPVFQGASEYAIPRHPLEKIKKLTTPAGHSQLYPLIIGEPGTGKTRLIEIAVDGMDEPKGVVYVDIPIQCSSEVDVARAMREALGWSSDQSLDSSQATSLWAILEVFSRAAIKYKQEYGKVPVLIIDNVNRLVQQQQQSLLNLFQDYAKDAADEETASVVFVSGEGEGCVPRRMIERKSSWSRCSGIVEIGDVSKEEALQYLKLQDIDDEQAAQIWELVGGRMIDLKFLAHEIKTTRRLEAICQPMFSTVYHHLLCAEVLPKHRYHKEGAAIIRELLKKGSISWSTYYGLVGADMGDKLLETKIFTFHFNPSGITFQSPVMKRFCEDNSALWEK